MRAPELRRGDGPQAGEPFPNLRLLKGYEQRRLIGCRAAFGSDQDALKGSGDGGSVAHRDFDQAGDPLRRLGQEAADCTS